MSSISAYIPSSRYHDIFILYAEDQQLFAKELDASLVQANCTVYLPLPVDADDKKRWRSLDNGKPGVTLDVIDCKVGVVVLSDAFIRSLRNMRMLHQLLTTSQNPQYGRCSIVYPIFYDIQPSDLVKEDNLKQWKAHWDQLKAKVSKPIKKQKTQQEYCNRIVTVADFTPWYRILEDISSFKGITFQINSGLDLVIKEIMGLVVNVCHPLGFIKGNQRITQTIEDYFDLMHSELDGPFVLGVVGSQGSGKTSLCRTMVDFYNQYKFPGKSFMLEFPSNEIIDKEELVQQLNTLIRSYHKLGSFDGINDVYDAISMFCYSINTSVENHGRFFAIDNVTYWSLPYVGRIIWSLSMQEGSKIIVTSRCKALLTSLTEGLCHFTSNMKIISVPSLNGEEALDALLSYCDHPPEFYNGNKESYKADLKCLVQHCFFNNCINPHMLKTLGKSLSDVNWKDLHEWKHHIRMLQTCCSSMHNGQLPREISNIIPDYLLICHYMIIGQHCILIS